MWAIATARGAETIFSPFSIAIKAEQSLAALDAHPVAIAPERGRREQEAGRARKIDRTKYFHDFPSHVKRQVEEHTEDSDDCDLQRCIFDKRTNAARKACEKNQ
ncbi:hypothetical protein CCAX7_36260 [Capsulimonas corticalis]|uniref:Uncharacterized protein n=1 Tax=Capsulimonas corticalis TaxID=2219043 RepID=A0A9N7L8N2_9BACT|nr:hypothetical protein CCAX7_36260 [Capsulimonas corticalis]